MEMYEKKWGKYLTRRQLMESILYDSLFPKTGQGNMYMATSFVLKDLHESRVRQISHMRPRLSE